MFVDRSVPRISREYERFAFVREMKSTLARHVQAAIADGSLPPDITPEATARVLTSAVIGVAVLRLGERLAPGEDADALARDMVDVTLAGLRSTPTLRARAGDCAFDEPPTSLHDASV
jgi:hypothetical protein